MMTNAELKAKAREQLDNKIFGSMWLMAALVCLIVAAITTAAGNIIPGIGAVLVTGPMFYGVEKLFYRHAIEGGDIKIEKLFDGFKDDFGGIFLLGLLMELFTVLWSLLLVVPGIIKMYAYSQAYYIKADHPEYDWRTCMQESIALMNGHKMELFLLDLSFIGWYILGAMCAGVGTLWVTAYVNAAHAQYYCELTETRVL